MEDFDKKKQKAISIVKKKIRIIEWLFFINGLFFIFSVFHSIWFSNKKSLKLVLSSAFCAIIILFAHKVYKKVEESFINLKSK